MPREPSYEELERKIKELDAELSGCKASLRRFTSAHDVSPIATALYGPDGRLLHMNKACLDVFGVSDTTEITWPKLLEDLHLSSDDMGRMGKGEGLRYELPIGFKKVNEQGLYETTEPGATHLNVHITPFVAEPEESAPGYLVQVVDISDFKQMETLQHESEEQYRTVFDESPISLWEEDFSEVKSYLDALRDSGVKDLKQYIEDHPEIVAHCLSLVKVVRVNKTTLKMYDAENVEEFIGELPSVLDEESFHVFREELSALMEGKTTFESEATNRTLKGNTIHILLQWTVAPGHEEALSKVLVSIIDITERKEAEAALEKQRRIHQAIIDKAHTHLVYLDRDFNFVAVNASYAETCHHTPEELIGKNHFFFYPHEENEAIFKQVRDSGEPVSFHDKPFEFPDQPERGITYWDWRLSPVFDDVGQLDGLVFSLVETTERKRAEENLRLAQKAESLARMAGAIAHSYNNLLSVVMSHLEMAMLDVPPESGIAHHLAQGIAAIHRASEISGLMLAYLGQTTAKQVPLDLSMLCRELLPDLRDDMPVRVTLQTDLTEYGPIVKANAAQIQQILRSLVTNAFEALGENQGVVSVRVRTVPPVDISALHRRPISFQASAEEYACLEVADTGCGIEEELIEKLFDPFYSTKFIGHGLGLPVALGTVKAHEGCITVKTAPGQGSVFRVYLPLTIERVHRRQGTSEATATGLPGISTVLLVEDDPLNRETSGMVLKRLGMTVIEAKDGNEAVDLFQEQKDTIHCVLCDLSMPRMNGWQTIEALRRLDPEIPVILTSGYDEARVMENMGEQMPQAFLRKPYSMAALKAALSKAMTDVGP